MEMRPSSHRCVLVQSGPLHSSTLKQLQPPDSQRKTLHGEITRPPWGLGIVQAVVVLHKA
jgi:hypothetical protein